jgi:hypothetical protein
MLVGLATMLRRGALGEQLGWCLEEWAANEGHRPPSATSAAQCCDT